MISAIIQARMSSTRLPGKVLLPLGDTTVLGMTVRQVKKAKKIGTVILATSVEKEDDTVAQHGEELGVTVFRGSLSDVLDRYYQASKQFGAEHICRITSDCPLIDPNIIDLVAAEYEKGDCDYISNGRVPSTYPDGMDTEISSFSALEKAWKEARLPSEREHVTTYIWNHPEMFRVREVKSSEDLSAVRLTVDEPEDYEMIKSIVANVPKLSLPAILVYLGEHPEVEAKTARFVRNEGYLKSLKQDEETKQS
ncbi:MAG: glycosyltransferase family protein [bacterium]|nr:glycosyltransferase family protein [bacterium]